MMDALINECLNMEFDDSGKVNGEKPKRQAKAKKPTKKQPREPKLHQE